MNRLKVLVLNIILLSLFTRSVYSQVEQNPVSINERFVLAALYAQVSGEFKALQLQAYNIAKWRISEYAKNNCLKGNEAIVLDIDETVLETFSYESKMIVENLEYPKGFKEFLDMSICKPVVGSLEFLNFIDSIGIKIFYVSNRIPDQLDALIINLEKYNYPQVTKSTILLKENSPSKEERRNTIREKNDILLLIGDSLEDFADFFKAESNDERNDLVMNYKGLFGDKFIVLPNPSYGTWESLIYKNNWKISPIEMDKLRKETLRRLYDY